MLAKRVCCLFLICTICCLAACGGAKGPERKIEKLPVVKVEGTVTVDGKPETGVYVQFIPQGDFVPKEYKNRMGGVTDEEGKFKATTYDPNDGVPLGEYSLTFSWPQVTFLLTNSKDVKEDTDRLKGKYADPAKSTIKVTVEKGATKILDPIELKTK